MSSIPQNDPSENIPLGYCQCGCGRKTRIARSSNKTLGWVKGQPIRYIIGHANRHRYQPFEKRFWSKVEKHGDDDCWLWLAARHPAGHGLFRDSSDKLHYAHRIAYLLTYGEIPAGKYILHKCNNPNCVNPAHLYAGTQKDNSRDMIDAGHHVPPPISYGTDNSESKLSESQVIEIRQLYANGDITTYQLADKFWVSQRTICAIIHRETWKHIP